MDSVKCSEICDTHFQTLQCVLFCAGVHSILPYFASPSHSWLWIWTLTKQSSFTWVTRTNIFTAKRNIADRAPVLILDIVNFGCEEVGVLECLVAADFESPLSQKDVDTWGKTFWYFWKACPETTVLAQCTWTGGMIPAKTDLMPKLNRFNLFFQKLTWCPNLVVSTCVSRVPSGALPPA